jgi:hypothetical protein
VLQLRSDVLQGAVACREDHVSACFCNLARFTAACGYACLVVASCLDVKGLFGFLPFAELSPAE